MGIRLVESIKNSCSGADPRWDLCRETQVQFDGEAFAVNCSPADCQPDGPHFDLDWSLFSDSAITGALTGWHVCELELIDSLGDLACDGYVAEPAA
jgi:hypothetical protein